MSAIEITRTWTATIEVSEPGVGKTTYAATTSEYDLLRDQTQVAVREAARLLRSWNTDVTVVLWKQTKARGIQRDRIFHVFQDRRGEIRYQ
jgi:hypothetical protein